MNQHRYCKETLDRLQTFLDRELSNTEISVVRFHLDKCPPCQHVFRFEDHLRRLVKLKACTEIAPVWLREQILARTRERRYSGVPGPKSQVPRGRNTPRGT